MQLPSIHAACGGDVLHKPRVRPSHLTRARQPRLFCRKDLPTGSKSRGTTRFSRSCMRTLPSTIHHPTTHHRPVPVRGNTDAAASRRHAKASPPCLECGRTSWPPQPRLVLCLPQRTTQVGGKLRKENVTGEYMQANA